MGKGIKAGKKKRPGGGSFGGGHPGGGGLSSQQAQQMRQLQQMQEQMEQAQAELEEKEVETTAGGGAVAVKVNGKRELVSLTIDPDVMDPEDPEMLQDLIVVAVNEGLRQIEEMSQSAMGELTGGLNLPI
ncbi:MAG: YbaB/EbfC family nucleoid-associated protein [Clostridiales Family XIII bacterium]|jgi:DNA-binding YbaB/EbfC family protein|nr:YbaB/EbfC family nucleoid-associated protein [Clostridiales Family XIII bacterium]